MGHKARPRKSPKPESTPTARPLAPKTHGQGLAVDALIEKTRHPVRPDKKRHKRIKEGNAFGKEDLVDWRNGAGRAKSWKLLRHGRTNSNLDTAGAGFLIDMVLAGVTVTQVLRPALPLALLKTGVRSSEGQLVNIPRATKSRWSHKIQPSLLDSEYQPRVVQKRRSPNSSTAERFIFTQRVGHIFLGGWLFEEYVVRDLLWEHCHLVGFTLHKVHLLDVEEICREDLNIAHIAHRFFAVGGSWRLAVVGKRLEEPSIFARYRAGTMTARVRRYFEDFPKPASPGGEAGEQLVSDFVAGLDVSAAQKKKKTRMVKQRMKRREKRAEAGAAKRATGIVAKENPVAAS